jgi:predicted nucleic acid-binding protein
LQTLAGLDIRIDQATPPIDGKALLPLVRRYGLTAYDAAYLELARRKGLPLATFDKDLILAATQEGVELVSQS